MTYGALGAVLVLRYENPTKTEDVVSARGGLTDILAAARNASVPTDSGLHFILQQHIVYFVRRNTFR